MKGRFKGFGSNICVDPNALTVTSNHLMCHYHCRIKKYVFLKRVCEPLQEWSAGKKMHVLPLFLATAAH